MPLKSINNMPFINFLIRSFSLPVNKAFFLGSKRYWENRYSSGGNSGEGSYGKLAEFKAEVINSFVEKFSIGSVIEFGCGDGHQLSLANYPSYIGLDVSRTAIKLCQERFEGDLTKSFFLYEPDCFLDEGVLFKCELALSLDVIFHLIEDKTFELYMKHLFSAAERFVIIYSSNTTDNPIFQMSHVKHRRFSDWVEANLKDWRIKQIISNSYSLENNNQSGSFSDFYIYEKTVE